MTDHRVRVTSLTARLEIGPRETRHLHVLRLTVGDLLRVFDGQGAEAEARIAELNADHAVLTLGQSVSGAAEPPFPLTLAVALLKGDKLSDVVRAATELGVARVQLLVTARADAREIGAQKLMRLNRVAGEASKQSRRAVTPEVLPPIPLTEFRWDGQLFVAQPGSAGRIMDTLSWSGPIAVLTGPEGGLTPAEVDSLLERGAHAVTLGPRVLRAETAPVALLGAIAAIGL